MRAFLLAFQPLLFSLVHAQQFDSQIPSCALPCYKNAVTLSGCSASDYVCQCGPATKTTTVQNSLVTCLTKSCSESDIFLYDAVAESVCASIALSSATAGYSYSTVTIGGFTFTNPVPTAGYGFSTVTAGGFTFTNPVPTGSTVTVGIGGVTPSSASGDAGTVTATPASSAQTPAVGSTSETKKNNNTGLIVGAVIGGVGAVALIVIALLLFLRWRKKSKRNPQGVQQVQPQPPLQPPTQVFIPHPGPGVMVDQKPQLHSESIMLNSPVTVENKDENKQMEVQTIPAIRTETGEMQGEGKPIAEVQAEARANPPVELDADWDWVAGRSRSAAPGPEPPEVVPFK